jgi:hypothetical protein
MDNRSFVFFFFLMDLMGGFVGYNTLAHLLNTLLGSIRSVLGRLKVSHPELSIEYPVASDFLMTVTSILRTGSLLRKYTILPTALIELGSGRVLGPSGGDRLRDYLVTGIRYGPWIPSCHIYQKWV